MADTKKKSRTKAPVEKKATVALKKSAVKSTRTVSSPEKKKAKKHGDTGVTVYMPTGETRGTVALPKALFAAKINAPLMAQAVRVYLANQRAGTAATKTRGQVSGSTRKIYKQKGTGNARHGSRKAPIFVGGGIIFGPAPRDYGLGLPKKMKKSALASALTSQQVASAIAVVTKLDSLPKKTREFAHMFANMAFERKILVLLGSKEQEYIRPMRNLQNVTVLPAVSANTYEVLTNTHILFTEQGVKDLETIFEKN